MCMDVRERETCKIIIYMLLLYDPLSKLNFGEMVE